MATATEAVQARTGGMSRRDEWAVAFFGTWMVVGLFLDGWAHNLGKPETFFSPWHALLYSGFAAAMVFSGITGWRDRARGVTDGMDRLMTAGVALFAAGGIGDGVWHEIFGIEEDIEALLSPTHLALMAGGLLMVTGPVRSAWADRSRRPTSFGGFLPTLIAITLATSLVSFFTMYGSAFVLGADPLRPGAPEYLQIWGVMTILLTNVVFLTPLLIVLRRWAPPPGTFTVLFGGVALLTTGLGGFERLPLVAAAIAAGVVADMGAERWSMRLLSGAVPAALWTTWFAVYEVVWGVGWTPELWTGSIVLTTLTGVGLGLLAFPPQTGSEVQDARA